MASNKRSILTLFLLYVTAMCCCSSCSLLETEPVAVPAYIYVPSLGFNTINQTKDEGDSSFKFVDVWIYQNGNTLGNIGLPARIPVQKSGACEIEFEAGIMKTGQDDTRIPYPFIARQRMNVQLSPNKIDTFYPDFKYLPSTLFEVVEGFEKPGFQFTYNPNNTPGDTVLKDTLSADRLSLIKSIRLGKACGQIIMSPASQVFEILSGEFQKEILQPSIGSPVYLEIDYKSDIPFDILMWSRDQNNTVQALPQFSANPVNYWNKVYVCLDQDIAPSLPGTFFKIAIHVTNLTGIPPKIFIDNIKLVHF